MFIDSLPYRFDQYLCDPKAGLGTGDAAVNTTQVPGETGLEKEITRLTMVRRQKGRLL